MRQELKFACRALVRSPTYAAAVIVTLVLGLGVNIAVATVAWSVLLRPLPVAEPDRIVLIYSAHLQYDRPRAPISFVTFAEWRARNRVFEELAVTTPLGIQLTDASGEEIEAAAVSDNFLRLLGVPPAEGRLLEPGDRNGTEGAVACVVSAAFARKLSGAGPAVGRRLEIKRPNETDGRTMLLVVGVMPDGVERWRERADVWLPAEAPGILMREDITSDGHLSFYAVGRLRPGVSLTQAGAAMSQLNVDVEREFDPHAYPPAPLRIVPLRDDVVPPTFQRTLALFAIAGLLVLAIAIANAGSLVLARLETRHGEVFIRAAIGASNADLLRYALAETAVLAAVAAAAGVPFAYASLRFLGAISPAGISGQAVRFSGEIALYTVGLTLAVAVILAVIQRMTIARATSEQAMRAVTPGASAASSRLLDALVSTEIAIACVILIAGVLVVRNFVRLLYIDPGFRSTGVLVANLAVDSASAGPEKVARDRQVGVMTRLIRERALALPGVEAAAVARRAPLEATTTTTTRASIVRDDGARFVNGSSQDLPMTPDIFRVGPGYFTTFGIPLLSGREFTEEDRLPLQAVIVSETMARLHWPGLNPVGRRLKHRDRSPSAPWAEVVGVVGDVRSRNLHDPPRPQMYVPLDEASQIAAALRLIVKSRRRAAGLGAALFNAFPAADARVRMLAAQPMDDMLRLSLVEQEYQSDLIGSFAALALALAAAGVYGLLNYRVARRRREMAIRRAVGATGREIAQLVLRRSALLVVPALAAGIAVALATTRVLHSLLFDISTRDPLTFTLVPLLFIIVAAIASLAPARRAVTADVAVVLREE